MSKSKQLAYCEAAGPKNPLTRACWYERRGNPCATCAAEEAARVAFVAAIDAQRASDTYYESCMRSYHEDGRTIIDEAVRVYREHGRDVAAALASVADLDGGFWDGVRLNIRRMPLSPSDACKLVELPEMRR
jgi:hypothetical protein